MVTMFAGDSPGFLAKFRIVSPFTPNTVLVWITQYIITLLGLVEDFFLTLKHGMPQTGFQWMRSSTDRVRFMFPR